MCNFSDCGVTQGRTRAYRGLTQRPTPPYHNPGTWWCTIGFGEQAFILPSANSRYFNDQFRFGRGLKHTHRFVQVLSCIPMCLSSVYKEKALGDDDMDVIYLNGWVAVFQFMASLLFAVPSAYAMGLPVAVSMHALVLARV